MELPWRDFCTYSSLWVVEGGYTHGIVRHSYLRPIMNYIYTFNIDSRKRVVQIAPALLSLAASSEGHSGGRQCQETLRSQND